jgi:hypothetical protein
MRLDGRWSERFRLTGHRDAAAIPTIEEDASELDTIAEGAATLERIPRRSLPVTLPPGFAHRLLPVAELALIALWAIWIAKPYLDFNESAVPAGAEYWINIQASSFWDRFETCGPCALWNGSTRGGYPAVADTQSAILHPIVALPALIWGWVNGAKVTIAAALFLAGFAQWWLARVLRLGLVARVWTGCLAAAAGSMTGRMDQGSVVLLVSGAACAMVLPPFIQLARDGRRRTAAILGLTIGLALVSGQAYLQIGGAVIAPFLLLVLLHRTPLGAYLLIRRYALAGVIGLLVAAPLIVPYLHVMSSYTKGIDPYFSQAQPLAYIPLNFVIDDPAFYRGSLLGKQPLPYEYNAYVGWLAVLLAFMGMATLWLRRERRLAIALGLALVLPLWIASAQPLRWLADATRNRPTMHEFFIGIRSVPLFAGIAVTPLLGFAAIGLDTLWRSSPSTFRDAIPTRAIAFTVKLVARVLLVLLLILTTNSLRTFSENWIYLLPDRSAEMNPVLDALETPDLQWVNTPYGQQDWWGPAIQRGLKLSINPAAWSWKPDTLPVAVLTAEAKPPEGAYSPRESIGDKTVYAAAPGNDYATITHPDGTRTTCSAHGTGGSIDVDCNAPQGGQLVVLEHMTSGWTAKIGREKRSLSNAGEWIAVDVPAGASHIRLRYRPWDVPLGIGLMLAGLLLAGGAIWRDRKNPSRTDTMPNGGATSTR